MGNSAAYKDSGWTEADDDMAEKGMPCFTAEASDVTTPAECKGEQKAVEPFRLEAKDVNGRFQGVGTLQRRKEVLYKVRWKR